MWLFEGTSNIQAASAMNTARGGSGFPIGSYFMLREKGSQNSLTTRHHAYTQGAQVQLYTEADMTPAYVATFDKLFAPRRTNDKSSFSSSTRQEHFVTEEVDMP